MNKRHYEHTLPNIRGSLSNTYYIYTRTKPNRLLIMKIGIVAIALTLFHNHALVHKELVKRHKDIASTLVTYTSMPLSHWNSLVQPACQNRSPMLPGAAVPSTL